MASPRMAKIAVEWKQIGAITRVERTSKALCFDAQVGDVIVPFTVTFPVVGGVRIRANDGFFAADEVHTITYVAKGELQVGELTACFNECEEQVFCFAVRNAKGDTVFTVNGDTFALGFADGEMKKMKFTAPFAEGDVLYGLGERYNGVNQVGRVSCLWNVDTGFGVDPKETYQNVPLLHSTAGYSIFFNTMYGGTAEFGVNTACVYTFDFNGPVLDVFFFVGTAADNLDSYTKLTGRPFLPPKWAYQYWMGSSWGCWKYIGEGTYAEKFQQYVDGYAQLGIHNIGTIYGEGISLYPDSYEISNKYNIRMLHWCHPSMRKNVETMEKMGLENEHDPGAPLVHMPDKESKAMFVDGKEIWYDFTHPRVMEALRYEYQYLMDYGIKGAMVDFGEYIHPEAVLYNGKDGNAMHNEHSYWYAKAIHELFDSYMGDDHALFMRSGCAGVQKYMMHFGGDQKCNFRGLKQAFVGGLNAGASAYVNWGSDIGGLGGVPSDELYIRWLQYSTFNPLMRAHAGNKHRNPWEYGELAVEVFKKLYWWRENMLPYVYSLGVTANKCGLPMMRVMAMMFPGNKAVEQVEDAFMFGSELMVAPVLDDGMVTNDGSRGFNERVVRFPDGDWVNLWNCEVVKGGRALEVNAPLDTIPVYLRAGAAMVLNVPADTLEICENMEEKELATALLVTPAAEKRAVVHYESVEKSYRFETECGDAVVTVSNVDGMALDAVLVYGAQATKVLADGKEVAFTVQDNKTKIALPDGLANLKVY